MDIGSSNLLKIIGEQLDRHQYPQVFNEGIVQPGNASVLSNLTGKVTKHERRRRSARSTTRPWEWTERWKRATHKQRPPCSPALAKCTGLQRTYKAQVAAILEAYPSTQVFEEEDGLWLLVESKVLTKFDRRAVFLIAVPWCLPLVVKGWGFWLTPVSCEWIGPRHTNFPDGSICAFDPDHGSWSVGGNLVTLLDIYTVWALRQEYLRVFGYWPGNQAAGFPYERLTELKGNEICGCNTENNLYHECCQFGDHSLKKIGLAIEYFIHIENCNARKPPETILQFMWDRKSLPPIREYANIFI